MQRNHTPHLTVALVSFLPLLACEAPRETEPAAPAPALDEGQSLNEVELSRPEQVPTRPRGIYLPVTVPDKKPAGVKTAMVAGGPPLPIFMNRNGGTYTGGFDDSSQNRSSVVGQGTATIGGYGGTDAQWQQVMSCVQEQFSRFNVYVTDIEPTSGDYVESVVGGHPSQVGLPSGVGGVAPIDNFQCNIISRAVVYTFTDNIGNNPQTVCEVAAQEIAHAFSLDHELLCEDPMTYLNGCGDKSFQDIDAQCGEYQPRACNCNRASHNSVQLLFEKLGPSDGTEPPPPPEDNGPPVVSVSFPSDGQTLPENSQIQVVAQASDDSRVASVTLNWEFNGTQQFGCPLQQQGISCSVNGDTYTWSLQVGTGTRAFTVTARDIVGNVVTTEQIDIQLGAVAGDTEAPVVNIVSPVDGGEREQNATMQVVATATDNVAVSSVELLWEFAGGNAFGCPMNQQAISCEIDGDTYTWTIAVGEGTRGFQVRARDNSGNETTSERRVVELVADPQPDPEPTPEPEDPVDPTDPDPIDPTNPTDPSDLTDAYEDNDAFDRAAVVTCGRAIDAHIEANDDDWYSLTVDQDIGVTVTASSPDGAPMHLAMTDAADRINIESNDDRAEKDISLTTETGLVALRVRSSQAGVYRLVFECDDALDGLRPDQPAPEGCSAAGAGPLPAFLALGLLALLRRRRR